MANAKDKARSALDQWKIKHRQSGTGGDQNAVTTTSFGADAGKENTSALSEWKKRHASGVATPSSAVGTTSHVKEGVGNSVGQQESAGERSYEEELKRLEARKQELTVGLDLDGAATVQMEIDELKRENGISFWQRVGNTFSGAGKQSTASWGDSASTMYAAGQKHRDNENDWYKKEYQMQYDDAARDYRFMLEDNEAEPGTWSQSDIETALNRMAAAKMKLDAMGYVVDNKVQEQAAETARNAMYQVAQSGAADIEKAKEGLGSGGRLLVDLGVGATQLATDAAANYLLFGGAKLPNGKLRPNSTLGAKLTMGGRVFGSSTMQARQDGASLEEQISYGGAMTALELLAEKLTDGLDAVYGEGATSQFTEKLVSKLGKTPNGQRVLRVLFSGGGEGVEGFISSLASPALQSIYDRKSVGSHYSIDTLADATYEFLIEGILGAGGGAIEAISDGYKPSDPLVTALFGQETENTAFGTETAVNENGLAALTEQEKTNLSSGKKNKVISTFSEAVGFIKNALSNKQSVDRAYLGKVPDGVAKRVLEETGVDITGYNAILPSDAVRHMFKNHGNEAAEMARGQVALTAETAANITTVLSNPDRVYLSDKTDARGLSTLIFEKQIGDYYITAQAVSDGTHSIQTDTLYVQKKKNPQDTVYDAGVSTAPVHNARSVPPQGSSTNNTIPQPANSVNSGTVQGFSENGTRVIAEIVENSGTTVQQVQNRVGLAYQTGRSNLPGTQLDLTDVDQQRAYNAGQMDYLAENTGAKDLVTGQKESYTDIKTEVPSDGAEKVHLRESGQRDNGTNSGGAVSAVESRTGGNQVRQEQGRPADPEAASLTYGEAVSTASLGIGKGSDKATIRVVTGGDTAETRAAKQLAKERGLRLTLFVGDNLNINGESVRAYITGDRAFVRADHSDFTSAQLMRHEAGHDMIAKGEIDPRTVRERIAERFGVEHLDHVTQMYIEAYTGSGLTAEEIWEEVICDSLGDMNIFSETVSEDAARELLTATKATSADAKAETSRGPPAATDTGAEGKMSVELSDLADNIRKGSGIRWSGGRAITLSKSEYAAVVSRISSRYHYANTQHDGVQIIDRSTDGKNAQHYVYLYTDHGFGSYQIIGRLTYGRNDALINFLREEIGNDRTAEGVSAGTDRLRNFYEHTGGSRLTHYDRTSYDGNEQTNTGGRGVRAGSDRWSGRTDSDRYDGRSDPGKVTSKDSRELDMKYMSAVNRGDTETARKMVNEFRDKVNWRNYYQKIISDEYNPDYFDDGDIARMPLDGVILKMKMLRNGEWSVVGIEEDVVYGGSKKDSGRADSPDAGTELSEERGTDSDLLDQNSGESGADGARNQTFDRSGADTQRGREGNPTDHSGTGLIEGEASIELERPKVERAAERYRALIEEYGSIAHGENPARDIQVPKRTADNQKVSQTVRTILEAKATPDVAVPTIEELTANGDFSYEVYTDKQAMTDAENTIRNKGYNTALMEWTKSVQEGEVSKSNTALGWALYNQAANAGDLKTAMSILTNMVGHQRNAAQAVQATRILKKMSPEAQLYGVQRSAQNLAEELEKRYGKDAPDIQVNEELARKYLEAETDKEREEAMCNLYRDLGRQMPSRFIDKWNAWRYLSMLGNPRTHVRNVLGNAFFAPVVFTKDMTATAIEAVVSRVSGGKLDRTKGAVGLGKQGRELLSAAWSDYEFVADQVSSGGKYSDLDHSNQYIQEGRRIFKSRVLEAARKGNSTALEAEDMWFSRPHYAYALAQYCKAHGISPEMLWAANEGQKNTATRGGKITVDSTEQERYEILKNELLTVVDVDHSKLGVQEVEQFDTRMKSLVEKPLRELAEKLGITGLVLENSYIDFPFRYSNKNIRKSIHHQLEYGGSYMDYAKTLSCLEELVHDAVLIETHPDYKVETEKAEDDLKQVYVMMSLMRDGDAVTPVMFEVKEFYNRENGLYMTVTLTKIDSAVMGTGLSSNTGSMPYLFTESKLSIAEVLQKVNVADGEFLKYIPDEFLNSEQKKSKSTAVERRVAKYGERARPKRQIETTPYIDRALLDRARAYAIKESQKATYRDTNAFSQTISELGRYRGNNKVKKSVGVALEGILPFRKTPANILVRGLEYSPLGFASGIKQAVWDVKRGNKTAAEAIDRVSAGLTGTGLLALGVFLAAQGLVRGSGGDDEEKSEFEELQGHQAYALELPDGTSVTLDWLAPEVLPFFVGVNLWEQTASKDDGGVTMSDILTATANVTEPLLEMSCLQSLNDVFDAVGYASSDGLSALPSALASAATSYLTQGFPTILGQAERTGEDRRMTTYTEKNAFLTPDMQYTLGRISARLPGWDYQQIPYIDAWGRMENTGTAAERAGNNFLNPAYTSTVETSPMEDELLRLYEQTGDGGVLPSRAAKYFNADGKRKDLTAQEYVKYAQAKGRTAYKVLTALSGTEAYRKMSDAEKVEAVGLVYDYANATAKTKVSGYKPEGWIAKAVKTEKATGLKAEQYVTLYLAQKGIESLKEADGDTIANSKSLLVMEMVYNVKGLTDAQRRALFEDFGVGKTVIHWNKTLVQEKLKAMRKKAA